MTLEQTLLQSIQAVLARNPGISAKMLVREINLVRSTTDPLTKRNINPVLYQNSKLFRSEGWSPPRWFNAANAAPSQSSPPEPRVASTRPAPRVIHTPRNVAPAPKRRTPLRGPYIPPKPIEIPDLEPTLYEWQRSAINAWKNAQGRGIVQAVTGSGKTHVALQLLGRYVTAGRRCLVLVPTVVLLNQWREAIATELGVMDVCLLGGGHGRSVDLSAPIIVGVIHTVSDMADELDGQIHLIIADEVHRYGAPKFQTGLLQKTPHRLGLTATFERNDDGIESALLPYFSKIIFEYDYGDAKRDEVISRYSVGLLGVDLSPDDQLAYNQISEEISDLRRKLASVLGTSATDKTFLSVVAGASGRFDGIGRMAKGFMSRISARKKILDLSDSKRGAVADLASAIESATKTIVFCSSVEVSETIVEELSESGVYAEAYHSRLSENERADVLENLQDGDIQAVVAVNALDEGVDVPDIDLGVIVSGSRQRRQMIQRMGRIVRRKVDKRGAAFIVIYARGTAEDPSVQSASTHESHLDILLDHSSMSKELNADPDEIEEFVTEAIWPDNTDISRFLNDFLSNPKNIDNFDDGLDDEIPF